MEGCLCRFSDCHDGVVHRTLAGQHEQPVREAIAGSFKDPSGSANLLGTKRDWTGRKVVVAVTKDDRSKLKEELEKRSVKCPILTSARTKSKSRSRPKACGLSCSNPLPALFSIVAVPSPNENGKELMSLLAGELGKLPNKISIEGHTDSQPFVGKRDYGNWELTTDRANSARRLMQQKGLGDKQVAQVRATRTSFCAKQIILWIPRTAEFRSS